MQQKHAAVCCAIAAFCCLACAAHRVQAYQIIPLSAGDSQTAEIRLQGHFTSLDSSRFDGMAVFIFGDSEELEVSVVPDPALPANIRYVFMGFVTRAVIPDIFFRKIETPDGCGRTTTTRLSGGNTGGFGIFGIMLLSAPSDFIDWPARFFITFSLSGENLQEEEA